MGLRVKNTAICVTACAEKMVSPPSMQGVKKRKVSPLPHLPIRPKKWYKLDMFHEILDGNHEGEDVVLAEASADIM